MNWTFCMKIAILTLKMFKVYPIKVHFEMRIAKKGLTISMYFLSETPAYLIMMTDVVCIARRHVSKWKLYVKLLKHDLSS